MVADKNTPHPLVPRARELRRRGTPAERVLWNLLRGRRLAGLKFRRQVPVGPYIVDFYCHTVHLGVELDGDYHKYPEQEKADVARTRDLECLGVEIMRFCNEDVLLQPDLVTGQILLKVGTRASQP